MTALNEKLYTALKESKAVTDSALEEVLKVANKLKNKFQKLFYQANKECTRKLPQTG